MRDDVVFTKRAAFGFTCRFCPLIRDELKIKTTQMPPLRHLFYPGLPEQRPPTFLPQSCMPARKQVRQPAQMEKQNRESGSLPRTERNTTCAGMAIAAPWLFEEKICSA
jgi:hypothetical protein